MPAWQFYLRFTIHDLRTHVDLHFLRIIYFVVRHSGGGGIVAAGQG